jgi:hypothetical protein
MLRPSTVETDMQKGRWPRTPGIRAIPNGCSPIPKTAGGATAPNVSRAPGDYPIPAAQIGQGLEYRLIKELWAVTGNRIAVPFQYERHDISGNWYRVHGNEQWEFSAEGLI